jgi:hypothetical protein
MKNQEKVLVGDSKQRVVIELNRLLYIVRNDLSDSVIFYFGNGESLLVKDNALELLEDWLDSLRELGSIQPFPDIHVVSKVEDN